MDKNTVTGLLLILAILLGYGFYNSKKIKEQQEKKAEELAEFQQRIADSIAALPPPVFYEQDTISSSQPIKTEPQTPKYYNNSASFFYNPVTEEIEGQTYRIETDVAKYAFAKKGGYLVYLELKDVYQYAPKGEEKPPLIIFDGTNNVMNIELMMANQTRIQTKDCYFITDIDQPLLLEKGEKNTLALRLYPVCNIHKENSNQKEIEETPDFDSYIEYLYTFSANDYRVGFDIRFVNMEKYLYANTTTFTLDWEALLKNVEKNYEYEKNLTSIYYMDNLSNVKNLNEKAADKQNPNELKWVSFKQQFFTSVLIADSSYFSSGQLAINLPDKNETQLLKNTIARLEFNVRDLNCGVFHISMYLGPNQYKLLKEYKLKLECQVPLGWSFLLHWINRLAVIPVFNWLESYGLSYGIIILFLTIILKIVLIPFAYKSYMSSAKMRVLKPEIDEISARFPKQEDAMKKQQATMALYKSAGASPMSGCLPMILQMPILIAMFRFFPSAYELRQQPFLWADDLSTYDSILNMSFRIPGYGDHVSLFCLLMTIATLIYTWLNNKMMTMGGNNDQMKMMRILMYIMPVMFLGIFNDFASGLTYYYLLVNLITFFQMWLFRMFIDEKKLREKLKLNMAKPMKKSKWQMKMEELAKQQQQMQKRKG